MTEKMTKNESMGCSRPEYPTRKDVENMSLVTLICNEEGIAGVADSKATRVYPDGFRKEDKKRGNIRKVFKNDKFIFVTYGNNEILVNGKKVNIEDWILKKLRKDSEPIAFFCELIYAIRNEPINEDFEYVFFYGAKDNNGYYLANIVVNSSNLAEEFGKKSYGYNMKYGGDSWYVKMIENIDFERDDSIEKIVEKKKTQFDHLIAIYDTFERYNPVGGPIQTEIFTHQ